MLYIIPIGSSELVHELEPVKKILAKFVLFLHAQYGVTPNKLTYSRIFAAPWLALLVSKSISQDFGVLTVLTLIFYFLIILTDFLDGVLARELSQGGTHDHSMGGMLDRLADKMLIIVLLIPFGLNLFTILLIGGESILAYNALRSPDHKKQATKIGKLKMLFQSLLIPALVISRSTNLLPDYGVSIFIIITIILTYASIYSHFVDTE